jgi:hypothetical protein
VLPKQQQNAKKAESVLTPLLDMRIGATARSFVILT